LFVGVFPHALRREVPLRMRDRHHEEAPSRLTVPCLRRIASRCTAHGMTRAL